MLVHHLAEINRLYVDEYLSQSIESPSMVALAPLTFVRVMGCLKEKRSRVRFAPLRKKAVFVDGSGRYGK
jgi:hypothetical protein